MCVCVCVCVCVLMCGCVGGWVWVGVGVRERGGWGMKTTAANITSQKFSKNSPKPCPIIHIRNIFANGKLPGCSMAVPMENNTSVKEANTRVIVAKTVITVDYLTARSTPRSLWNCEVHSATESFVLHELTM